MEKIIREVRAGMVQITVADERWYIDQNGEYPVFVPSVTWQAHSYPKGIGYYKWLAEHGWDEAEAIKEAAGEKGSKVHLAIADLIAGKEVHMDAKYPNRNGIEETLSLEEWDCILSFADFWKSNPGIKVIASEIPVFMKEHREDCEKKKGSPTCSCCYAGTIDLVCEMDGDIWVIDFKTSQYIWPEYELQLSAYKHALPPIKVVEEHGGKKIRVAKPVKKIGILNVGYKRNKNKWKFTEIEDKFDLFGAAQRIWFNEHGNERPSVRDYPEKVSLVAIATQYDEGTDKDK
jgi:hypothetical protein